MNLLVPQGVGDHVGLPGTQLTPRIQDGNAHGCTCRLLSARGLVKGTELSKDFLHAVNELGELERQG